MSVLNLGVLNSIKNGVSSLISGVNSLGKGTNSQTLTLEPGVQTTTNIFDVSDVNALIAIRLTAVTLGDVECGVRYHDEDGGVSFVGELFNFSAQSIYEQREIQLRASRVSFRLTNNGEVDKTLTLTLSKTTLKKDSSNVVSLFDDSSVELVPLATTITSKEFEFDSDYVRIGFYGLSGTFPANLEIIARYTTPSGSTDYVLFDPNIIVTEVKSGYNEGVLVRLKYRKVSFRFRNTSASSFTLSRIVASKVSGTASTPDEALYTREKQIQSLFSRDSVILEPGDTTVYSDILEINGEYGVIGMRGAAGTPSTPIEISPRYHGQDSDIIYTGDSVFTNVADRWIGKVAAVFPMIHKRVSFRIVNRGDTAITINNVVISPRDTDPNSNSLINFPLSPDGAMYVQLKDEVDSAAYDAFYGSLKTLRTYKPDFRIVVAPPTPKTTATDEAFEYSLQNGADHVRIYLNVTVTGNPFPAENDGVSLNIFYKDEPFETLAMTGNKIKMGSTVYLLGKTLNEIQSVDALFGDDIKVILKTTGTIDASNNFTYEIVSYQKFV